MHALPGDVLGSMLAMSQTSIHHRCFSLMGLSFVDGKDGSNRGSARARSKGSKGKGYVHRVDR